MRFACGNDESNKVVNISTFLVRYSLFKNIFCQKKHDFWDYGNKERVNHIKGDYSYEG